VAERVDPSTGAVERSYYLDLPEGEVWCCLHWPAGEPRGGAVVCSPLYSDFLANYHREVRLARALTDHGIGTARFHYPGTGNSGGEPAALSWDSMTAAAAAVVDHLAHQLPGAAVGLVGTRLGALVAAEAGAGPLVAWEPVLDPGGYLREGIRACLARTTSHGGRGPTTKETLAELAERGWIDLLGFRVERGTYESLRPLTLPDVLGPAARDVLLVQFALNERVGSPLRRAEEELRSRGHRVTTTTAAVPETWWFHSERHPPSGSLIPDTVTWLSDRLAASTALEAVEGPSTVASRSGAELVERPLWIPGPAGDVFAVLTEPEGRPVTAISLQSWDAGASPSPGRDGFRARLASTLARSGIASVRFDYRGVGESGGQRAPLRLDDPDTGDARAALAWLDPDGSRPAFLIGSCYGGRVALAAARSVPDLRGLVLMSAPVRDEQHLVSAAKGRPLRYALRQALRLNLRDPVRRRADLRRLRRLVGLWRRQLRHGRAEPTGEASDAFLDAFGWVVERGVPVLLVHVSESDFYEDFEEARRGELGRLLASAGEDVEIVVIEGMSHLYDRVEVQDRLLALIQRWTTERLPRGGHRHEV
jgi:alpha/beta superfamily hydrolase